MKLWCFGDSNTYGYDPCGFIGGRYAAPWPELLAEKTGFQVINDGKNGRMIPEREYEFVQLLRDVERQSADVLIVMLGTNDLLNGATAAEAAARMEAFLNRCHWQQILLLCPPPMKRGAWVPDDRLVEESKALSRQYEPWRNDWASDLPMRASGRFSSPLTEFTLRKRDTRAVRKG